jgi:uncharacterized protein YndB with AHSA1/START domain
MTNDQLQLNTPASPRDVWRALTSPELTARYLYGMAATSSWLPGAPLRLAGNDGAELTGEVLSAAEPRRLSYSLQAGNGQPSTYVTWEISDVGSGSLIRLYVDEPDDLTAGRLDLEAAAAWAGVLSGLKDVLASASIEPAGPSCR